MYFGICHLVFMDITEFKKLPILGILRGVEADAIDPLAEAVVASGLKTLEITMNTQGASALIKETVKASNGRFFVGAGTVLNMGDMHKALEAGATFIVCPTLVKDVVEYCAKNNIPVFPGALTPQEIFNAWEAGATMVKVFPAKFFGPTYFKEIKGPFNHIDLLACGGVNAENVQEFFQCGASAVAFGASIFKKEWLQNKDFVSIENEVTQLVDIVKNGKWCRFS